MPVGEYNPAFTDMFGFTYTGLPATPQHPDPHHQSSPFDPRGQMVHPHLHGQLAPQLGAPPTTTPTHAHARPAGPGPPTPLHAPAAARGRVGRTLPGYAQDNYCSGCITMSRCVTSSCAGFGDCASARNRAATTLPQSPRHPTF
jgi:hypothetical protein